ncbi:MAG: S-layer homology domain-containing protein [Candidatus Eremiobacteraeota bacterium]|nr:S-layer homology domain-containing protein [Candidatus Eremiobacteraeota bacterium]
MQYRVALFAATFAASTLVSACTSSQSTTTEQSASPTGSAAAAVSVVASTGASASPGAAGTPVSYTDLVGVPGAEMMTNVASLGVFGMPTGTFNPSGTITRGDFVKWLVLANNAIFASEPDKVIRPSQSTTSSYPDVTTTDPNFSYIQGMYDAGFAVGFPDKTFKPSDLLTREQMIAIKESIDRGGVVKYYVNFSDSLLPNWKDKAQINKLFRGAIAEDYSKDRDAMKQGRADLVIDNVPRVFGGLAMLRPQQPVTRAQAALVVWKIGAHSDKVLNALPSDVPRSAADALASATATP